MKCKKVVLGLILGMVVTGSAVAQNRGGGSGDGAFGEGKIVISAGYGFPNLGKTVLKTWENDPDNLNFKATGFGPMHFKAEYGLSDKIGIGLSVNQVSFAANWEDQYEEYNSSNGTYTTVTYKEKLKYSSTAINGRLNIHFGDSEKLDAYWGIGGGYKLSSWKFTSENPNRPDESIPGFIPVSFETTFGVRYYFTPNIGFYSEIGYAKSIIQAGISAKF
jgi:hypothetical protein